MSKSELQYQKAIGLSKLPYFNQVSLDETTDGESIFIAKTLELPGCISQGKTAEEALHNLGEARIDYLFSLLEDGLSIPQPSIMYSETKSTDGIVFTFGKSAEDEINIRNPIISFIQL